VVTLPLPLYQQPVFQSIPYCTHRESFFLNHAKNVLIRSVFLPTDLYHSLQIHISEACSLFSSSSNNVYVSDPYSNTLKGNIVTALHSIGNIVFDPDSTTLLRTHLTNVFLSPIFILPLNNSIHITKAIFPIAMLFLLYV